MYIVSDHKKGDFSFVFVIHSYLIYSYHQFILGSFKFQDLTKKVDKLPFILITLLKKV